jgi:hypothetical protein
LAINQEGHIAMTKNQNRGHRETRRLQQELPQVPNLGNLSMPRKGNRAAAKYVASIGNLWDRRRADRKAIKNALARRDAVSANPRKQHLDKKVREQMLVTMSRWRFDHQVKAFVSLSHGATQGYESFPERAAAIREGHAERNSSRPSSPSATPRLCSGYPA